MKITISAIVIATAGLVSAQNFGAEPSCAIPCLTSAISAAGCALSDEACQCGTGQAAIQTAVTPCLLTNCSPGDLQIAASVGFALCSAYTLTAGSGTPSNTSMIVSTPTVTGVGNVSVSTVTARTTSVPVTTGGSVTVGGKGSGTTAGTTTGSSKGSSSSTASGAGVVSSAGAGQMQVMAAGLGGVVGMVGAFMAAL